VQSCGIAFWGVDILFEETTWKPYLSEVNSPCDFAGTQKKTWRDIAGEIVDYLLQKAKA
jgi:glutathione synthase/RimK-type ligase-like ATP-grasp enzyme